MLDFLKNIGKSDKEKRQERITAYLDNTLSPIQQQRFEDQMANDPALRNDVEQQQKIKTSLSHLPRMKAPRQFTLDPALYGKPEPAIATRLYPAMRVATALAGILFVVALSAQLLFGSGSVSRSPAMFGAGVSQEAANAPRLATSTEAAALGDEVVAEQEMASEEPMAAEAEVAEEAMEEAPPVAEMPVEESAVVVTVVVTEAEADVAAPAEEAAEGGGIQPTVTEAMEVVEGESVFPSRTPTPAGELGIARATEGVADGAAISALPRVTPSPSVQTTTATVEALAQKSTSEAPPPELSQQQEPLPGQFESQDRTQRQPMSVPQLFLIGLGIAVILLAVITYWLGRHV